MQQILLDFNNKYTKTINKTKIHNIEFYWEFCGFSEIINTNNFFTFIETRLKMKLNKTQEDHLVSKIDCLRSLLNHELISSPVSNKNLILNYLLKCYTSIRDFINETLFAYVLYSYLHEDIEYQHQVYDIDDFYQLCQSLLTRKIKKIET
ncbi:hypothetical protein SCLARK_00754 [Spiroplasma clarkii]|uniref:Uncharacterized protein n=1 Tax=Spiroplasma clarkii TaxID=2139 RepID=A0A1Y0L067_9MOLU|nr:hypothetical protein [Spiroplasma clarkii]ARU91397.1 hypothetical protein SCLARK_00754 [Spiroplasma clarkii]ATX70810.1 hypothetical protein SCLAR_v1c04910 [Spiroplasma clarkii]